MYKCEIYLKRVEERFDISKYKFEAIADYNAGEASVRQPGEEGEMKAENRY